MSYDRKVEPTQITQGEQIAWTRTFMDYPADEYTLAYRFRGDGPGFNVAATADGDAFDAVVTPDDSAACSIGRYRWQAWLTEIADTDNTFKAAEGVVNVNRGFTDDNTASIDLRSDARKILDAIDAALLAAGSGDVVEYELSVGGNMKRVRRRSDLLEIRKYYARIVANEVARERVRSGGSFGRQIKVRMYDND